MPACPHCKRAVPALRGKCPGCSRELGGLALGKSGSGGFVLEGLDAPLAAPPAKTTPAAAKTPSPPVEDEAFELDPFEHDLSMVANPAGPAATTAPSDSDTDLSTLELDVPSRSESAVPSVRPIEDLSDRAAGVAAFGEKPSGLVDAVRYALRVRTRKAQMRAEIDRLTALRGGAQKSENDALAALAAAARAAGIEGLDGDAASEARAAESRVDEEAEALAGVERAHQERLGDLERSHALAIGEVPAMQALEAERSKAHAERRALLQRAQARVKRAEIEIRSRQKLVGDRRAAGQAKDVARLEAEIASFEGERTARAAEASALEVTTTSLERELAELRKGIAAGLGKGSLVLEERRREEEAFRRRKTERARRVNESAADAQDRLASLGRVVLGRHAEEPGLADAVGAARAATFAKELLDRELDVLGVAMQSYDAESVKTGWMVLGGGAALGVLAIVALALWS